uniref:Reverse transcriptase domain-containing protein n=1 Tax=Schistocephalus solidus TaxID=70667 RepID=A0A183TPU5_SCHSO
LRNNKTPRENGKPSEIYKSCVDTLAPWLHEVIAQAWRVEVVPDDWSSGILVPVHKKRFQTVRDSRTRPIQGGFRARRGWADQIFILSRILGSHHRYQQPTVVCFFEFVAAVDSVRRESLWRIIVLDSLPSEIIVMIKAYYGSTTARVLVHNNRSQVFNIRSCVRQCCILSRILFNYAIDRILGKTLHEEGDVELAPGRRLADLDYADDITLLASNIGTLQSMASRVYEVTRSVGLTINAGKPNVVSSWIPAQEKAPTEINGYHLEEVDSFKYIELMWLSNGQSKNYIVA